MSDTTTLPHLITTDEARIYLAWLWENDQRRYHAIRQIAVEQRLTRWPEGEGFGSSDTGYAMVSYVVYGDAY